MISTYGLEIHCSILLDSVLSNFKTLVMFHPRKVLFSFSNLQYIFAFKDTDYIFRGCSSGHVQLLGLPLLPSLLLMDPNYKP